MKITPKMQLDVDTMRYFCVGRVYVKKSDKEAMAIYSATGKKPAIWTKGLEALKWGKTYRDEQVTAYIRDIELGLFTKTELLESMPNKRLKDWLWGKIEKVRYDVNGSTSRMAVTFERNLLVESGQRLSEDLRRM